MIGILLITTGTFLHYSKSKYYPKSIKPAKSNVWLNLLSIIAGAGLLIDNWGWASGLLYALCAYMLATVVLQIALITIDELSKKS
ncbi:hypothetical protein [Emticicia fluvialis]|uniref:hypothetical protein n=1 Tax=Emticicia fluvialis TaxID=2974474 RepID=UPI0021660A00|nr:hypothetical protein [Emticicia fluvialis]